VSGRQSVRHRRGYRQRRAASARAAEGRGQAPAGRCVRARLEPADVNTTTRAPALSEILLAAAQAVQAVQSGASLTDALAAVPAALRPSTQAISFHAMRRLGTAMAIRSLLIPRKPPSALLDSLLLVSFSLLAQNSPGRPDDAGPAQRTDGPSYADHTVVD